MNQTLGYLFAISCVAVRIAATDAAVPREHLLLADNWEVVSVQSLDDPVPATGWRQVSIPATRPGYGYARAWYRHAMELPESWKHMRIKLSLQGAKYCPIIYVNNQRIGEHFGGYEPCEFDITDALGRDGKNELRIGIHDYTALFKGERKVFPDGPMSNRAVRTFPKNCVMGPMGGRVDLMGLWDDVVVYPVAPVHLSDAFIQTDVEHQTINVEYTLTNETRSPAEVTLTAKVMDDGTELLSLPRRQIRLDAQASKKVTLGAAWNAATITLWSPEQPRLYHLVSTLTGPSSSDERRDRFGFRQMTIKGCDFYLNGVRRHLLASSAWPMRQNTHDEITDALRRLKQANVVAFRTHTQPWRQIWYDVADELGLMMIPEGAVWNDDHAYALDEPDFWRNWGNHLTGMVRALRNHPSVVMWSIENEFFGNRAANGTDYEKHLAELGLLVKKEDPSRPIYYESDGDPGRVADVIGVHYPNEPPDRRLWPNDAYWMDKPCRRGSGRMFWPSETFIWDRAKPLYIGEYLWWPSGTPEGYTLAYGDDAYSDLDRYRRLAKAMVWRWQTIAYRHYGVSGICPWTLVEGGDLDTDSNPMMAAQAYAMEPLAAYIREETRRAYAGDSLTYHLEVFNDLPESVRASLTWHLIQGERVLQEGEQVLDMEPGDRQCYPVAIDAPQVTDITRCVLRAAVSRRGSMVFRDEKPLTLYPRRSLATPSASLYLFDPDGATARLLQEQHISHRRVTDLADFAATAGDLLIIGENALSDFKDDHAWSGYRISRQLRQCAAAGGRIIVLAQRDIRIPLPAELDAGIRSTMCFIQAPGHPMLAGLEDDAFKFWQPDHTVTAGELRRLAHGGCVPLVVTGDAQGLSHAALAEARRGRGIYLMCQIPLVDRFKVEPMASQLLERLLRYASTYRGAASKVLFAGTDIDTGYKLALDAIGLDYRPSDLRAEDLDSASTVLLRGGRQDISDALLRWVHKGGRLVLDRPTESMVAAVGEAAGFRLYVNPYGGAPRREESDHPLVQAIAREDLHWVQPPEPGNPGWYRRAAVTNVADGALGFDVDIDPLVTIDVNGIKATGHVVATRNDHIVMASAGQGRAAFTVPTDGEYLVGVEARGSSCQGVYAACAVKLDGQRIGMIYTREQWQRFCLPTHMKAGPHKMSVQFINDAQVPPEDRNFYLRRIVLAPRPDTMPPIVPIAAGPCVAALPIGQGKVIVNFIRWNEQQHHDAKGRRFWASLLTGTGADFRDPAGASYDLTTFTPSPKIGHYKTDGGYAYLGSRGWIEGDIEVPGDGDYRLIISAAGTRADDVYPEVVIWLDGRKLSALQLVTGQWRDYETKAGLKAGSHRVRLQFTNDLHRPPEDRNLMLDRLLVVPVE